MTLATQPSAELATLADAARDFAEASRAPASLRGYKSDWRQFSTWCDRRGLASLPAAPATVALYVSDRAGVLAVATVGRHLASIAEAHRAAGHEPPTAHPAVRRVWKGIRRTFGTASTRKQPLEVADIRAMVARLGATPRDIRDRALLLVAFAAALRRSEVAALDAGDVTFVAEGLVLRVRRSKTDVEGQGVELGVPYGSDPACCPVRALQHHLDASGATEGPIFRAMRGGERMSGRAVAERIKRLAANAGHDPDRIGGHSTRRGFITSAARAGALERDIAAHSRHRSLVVLRGYIAEAGLFDDNPAAAVL